MSKKSKTDIYAAISRIQSAPNMKAVITAYDAAYDETTDVSAHRHQGRWQVWHGEWSGFCGSFSQVRAHLAEKAEESLERLFDEAAEQAPSKPAMVQQQAQQQQAKAGLSIDDVKAQIGKLVAAKKKNTSAIAGLIRMLPGVEVCEHRDYGDELYIRATGTRCGSLDKAHSLPFVLDAFAIPFVRQSTSGLNAAIERAQANKQARADLVARDGFDRAIDKTIIRGPYTATVEPVYYGEIAVSVTALLRDGTTRDLGRVVMCPQETRGEVLDMALDRLGYGYAGINMDADDGSWTPTAKRAALQRNLAKAAPAMVPQQVQQQQARDMRAPEPREIRVTALGHFGMPCDPESFEASLWIVTDGRLSRDCASHQEALDLADDFSVWGYVVPAN